MTELLLLIVFVILILLILFEMGLKCLLLVYLNPISLLLNYFLLVSLGLVLILPKNSLVFERIFLERVEMLQLGEGVVGLYLYLLVSLMMLRIVMNRGNERPRLVLVMLLVWDKLMLVVMVVVLYSLALLLLVNVDIVLVNFVLLVIKIGRAHV